MNSWLAVAIGGALGAMLRFGITEWLNSETNPWGTLTANIVGSLLLGMTMAALANEIISKDFAILFGSGLLGAFTTMSTFSLETVKMWESSPSMAVGYVAITMIACPMLAFAGWKITELAI
jgi:CrcB protein|tara:strand:+ start:1892 stop:2254 length:363 start_codon:yes stop_codon:yes gene_type:complete